MPGWIIACAIIGAALGGAAQVYLGLWVYFAHDIKKWW